MNEKEIREKIFSMRDEKYREFHCKLVPGEATIIGVRVPVLRKYARELYKEYKDQAPELIRVIGNDYYEEIMLQGMIIGIQRKIPVQQLFCQIDEFVPKIKNWGICDVFCGGLNEVKKYRAETFEFLQKYLDSDDEFKIRFGLVMLLSYYVDEEYIDKVLLQVEKTCKNMPRNTINKPGDGSYYVKMAAAWLISVCFVKFYDKTKRFISDPSKDKEIDDFTYNKAIQKARESYRITPEQKEELKRMKRGVKER